MTSFRSRGFPDFAGENARANLTVIENPMNTVIKTISSLVSRHRDLAAVVGLAAFAFAYFGSLYDYGYDWGDIGSYAQICYEVYLGSSPTEFVGYGVGWYIMGAALFHLVGVNYTALMVMIYTLMFMSTCLLFFGIRKATGRYWPAVVAEVVMILVPSFPASTVRLICLALFLLPIVILARAPVGRGFGALAAAAVAVAIVAGLRQEFGYIFLAVLLTVVAARSWSAGSTFRAGCLRFGCAVGVILLVLAVAFAPVLWFAAERGILTTMWLNYVNYYWMLREALVTTLTGGISSLHSEFLRMPAVSAIWGSDPDAREFAFLVYSTTAGLVTFGLYTFLQWYRRPAETSINLINLTVVLVVASQWPIFALFRPDWSHFVTFMQAYLLLAAVALTVPSPAGGWRWPLKAPVVVVIGAQVALFVVHGMQAPGMGWFAQRQGRDAVFDGPVGIHVKVSTGERLQFEAIDRVIRASSRPDESIICVPYCAGFAFMAGRRMLFRQHYVDDSVGAGDPGWIERAIALTGKMQTPVIIVQDWAPNGTEASRFGNWASRYMDFVRRTYPVAIRLPAATIWLLKAPSVPPSVVPVANYGPKTVTAEASRPGGDLALWLLANGLRATAEVQFDGKALVSTVGDNVITALIPQALVAVPGRHWLQVVDPVFAVTTTPVPFEVVPPASP